ncbi:Uncharacterized protein FKW44_022754, partial [Caligus rogercresseyi]
MWTFHILLPLLCLAIGGSQAQLIQALFGNECLQKNVPPGMCAGWELPVGTGYTELSFRYRNDAEAVVVKKGCIFTGYDHAGSTDAQRGERVRIDGRNHNKPGNPWKDLDRDSLVDEISSVICECPATEKPSSNARIEEPSRNARAEERRKIDPRSNIPERKCPTISRTACAMLFDEEDCEADDYEAIILNDGEERSFSLLKSVLNFQYKNDIESFIVRDGCTLEAYDDSDFSDDGIRVSAKNGDLLVNLDDHPNDRYEDLDNDIESVRCYCS